jgi:penicillin-binding protein 1A
MRYFLAFCRFFLVSVFSLFMLGVVATAGLYLYMAPSLPSIETLKDVQLQVPLRVFARDSKLLAEFGEKKRNPLKYKEVTPWLVKAVLAAEDDRFFEHPGVDYQGILRAVVHLARTGKKGQGGSTITMQVARNFFLSREKTYFRKLSEIFLALKIESELTKEEILELYLNKIYLGNRAYGFGAASQIAMLAGLPKAPSRFNPIVNPSRAVVRRNYVLGRMHDQGFIDADTYEAAQQAPVTAQVHGLGVEITAPYIAEMVRAYMHEQYGEQAYTAGYRVYTTLDSHLQGVANTALQDALVSYDRRHGYRGPEGKNDLSANPAPEEIQTILKEYSAVHDLLPALVLSVDEKTVEVVLPEGKRLQIPWSGLSWARKYFSENRRGPNPKTAAEILSQGDVIRIQQRDDKWRLAQIPEVEGALVSLRPEDGAVNALVGGYNFYQSKFNRVTQAMRQPGSSFKPFIYSAALEKGFTAASIINDAPVVFDDPGLEDTWRPENYSGKFFGPTRMRVALTKSRNLVSIRLLREMGIRYAIDYASRFGFDKQRLPRNLSLALGTLSITPLQLARAYSTFANGGFLIEPYFIDRIEDSRGEVIYQAEPVKACRKCEIEATNNQQEKQAALPPLSVQASSETTEQDGVSVDAEVEVKQAALLAPRIMTPQNHYLMVSMMQDVIREGTGRRALTLGRKDLAGKTGTTNDQIDAWFAGYNQNLVTVCWTGFDKNRPLGNKETGSRAALPMWISFMAEALKGMPETTLEQPSDMVSVRIDPETGLLASADNPRAIFEIFRTEYAPTKVQQDSPAAPGATQTGSGIPEQLF